MVNARRHKGRAGALALAAAMLIGGCGGGDSTPADTVRVQLKLQLPALPIADEGSSTGIRLTDDAGDEVYNENFWKLPRGRPNEAMDTVVFTLDETSLEPGIIRFDAVIRACNASGCSAEDLGEPMVQCKTDLGLRPADSNFKITVVFKDREPRDGCGFAISGS